MMNFGEDEMMQGIDAAEDVFMGDDGQLYQWVQGVDGLGNPIGFVPLAPLLAPVAAAGVRAGVRAVARRLAARRPGHVRVVRRPSPRPFVVRVGGARPIAARIVRRIIHRLIRRLPNEHKPCARYLIAEARRAGIPMPGVNIPSAPPAPAAPPPAAEAAPPAEGGASGWGLSEDDLTQTSGVGYVGEVRTDLDSNLYQWVEGYDSLGNPVGAWRRVRGRPRPMQRMRRRRRLMRRMATSQPAPTEEESNTSGWNLGCDGVGALYQAPDGTLYQVQGLAEDDLDGFAEDELQGFAQDELQGFAEDELQGFAQDELQGFAQDELQGFAQDELQGLSEDNLQGYVPEQSLSGLDGYVPAEPPRTRWFIPPAEPPEMWRPLW